MKIAITGHRPNKLGGYAECSLHESIRGHMNSLLHDLHKEHAKIELLSGGALGIDQWWLKAGISMSIPVHAILPFEGFDNKWPQESRDELKNLLDKCASVRYCTDYSPPDYSSIVGAMYKRNLALVNECDLMIAYWDGSNGGTANAVAAANRAKRSILIFDPNKCVMTSVK